MTTVLAAGVAVIDFVMQVDEMPRRAEKYRARDAAVVGGGCAAGAAATVARLGGKAFLATRLGADPVGDMIIAGLEGDGVDCSLVKRFEGRRSSFSSVFVDAAGERQIVNFRDMDMDFGGSWLLEAGLPPFDAAVADTRWPLGAAALMQRAKDAGVPGIMDAEAPVREALDAIESASHVAFSAQGLADLTGTADIAAGLAAARDFCSGFVCVTDGGHGASYLDGGAVKTVPAFAVYVVDTLGAGDVWHGAFALALGEGQAIDDALRFSNAVASIKCSRFGGRSGVPTRAETTAFLKERS
jgi:sulfofructose kinase